MSKLIDYVFCFILLSVFILLPGCGTIALKDDSSLEIKYQLINLKDDKDRREMMDAQFKLAKLPYTLIEAIWGKGLTTADVDNLVKNGQYDLKTKENSPLSGGELGLYLTSLNKALPNALANKQAITITFEDDMVIPYDLDLQFRQALRAVPEDWDILYLSCLQGCLTTIKGEVVGPYTPAMFGELKGFKYPLCVASESHRVYGTPWIHLDGGCVAGTGSYATHARSAEKLLKLLTPMKHAVDRMITNLVGQGKINAYCLKPELTRANTLVPSTIR